MVDTRRLKASWDLITPHGDQVPLFFYSTLFLTHPEVRNLFPVNMSAQRDKLVGALGAVISNVDNLDAVVPVLQQLGRDHRKFGAIRDHYPAVGEALLVTLRHFSGSHWTPELEEDWRDAYELVAKVMAEAAEAAAVHAPAWWDAEVLSHERRTLEVAVLTLRPHTRLDYRPGQSITVESPLRPKMWRHYSPANAPREDGTIELHVRMADAGAVSPALVDLTKPGDVLRLGPPVGTDLVAPLDDTPLLLLAGGTGLAPLKAITELSARQSVPRQVRLYWAIRSREDCYDLQALSAFAAMHDWFHFDADAHGPSAPVSMAALTDLLSRGSRIDEFATCVCGPPGMVSSTVAALTDAGVPQSTIHFERLDYEEKVR